MNEPIVKTIVPGTISVTSGVGLSLVQFNQYLQTGALIFALVSGIITAYRFYYWYRYERQKK